MIFARREVDVVVARSTGRAARMREPPIALRRRRRVRRFRAGRPGSTLRRRAVFVTHLAIAGVRREDHSGEVSHGVVEADNPVRMPRLYAGQGRAHMDLVNQHLEIDGIASIGVHGLDAHVSVIAAGIVAKNAKRNFAAGASMSLQWIVALVASRRVDDVMNVGGCGSIRCKAENGIRGIRAKLELA